MRISFDCLFVTSQGHSFFSFFLSVFLENEGNLFFGDCEALSGSSSTLTFVSFLIFHFLNS